MNDETWDALPIEQIAVDLMVFPLHHLSIPHIFPEFGPGLTDFTPIRATLLSNGTYLVEDGRHRAIRAMLTKRTYMQARVRRYENV